MSVEQAVEVPCLRKESESKGQFVRCSVCGEKKVLVLGETSYDCMVCLECFKLIKE